jgi:hypothetical protein
MVILYCYRPVVQVAGTAVVPDTGLKNDPVVPATPVTTAVKLSPTITKVTPPSGGPGSAGGSTGPQVTTVNPTQQPTPAPVAKPSSVVDSVMSFFASIFGAGTSSGNSSPPAGGNMEPTPSLPGGMKPVTQVTTAKPKTTINPAITVTSPPAGADYYTGSVIPVTWIKPDNPSGTVTLKLVTRGGNSQSTWASAVVPNTGSFDWHQQDLARDCGVGNNPDCWGGLNPDDLGITSPIQYQDAWDLPASSDVAVEISTSAMDPYPAFYGSSGTFTILNGHAFVDTSFEQARYYQSGSYPAQVSADPGQTSPWVGYRNSQNGNDPAVSHEMWRTVIIPAFGSGYSVGDTIKKATLTVRVTTDKGTGNGITPGTHDVKDHSAVAQVWVLSDKPAGFKKKSELPVIAAYDLPTTAGSTAHGSYDPATGTIIVDLTEPVNQWFTTAGTHALVLVGPDESSADTPGFFYSTIGNVTFVVEKA